MKNEYLFIILAGIFSGFVGFGGQILVNLRLSFYQIAIFSLSFVFILLPFILFKKECKIQKEAIKLFAVYGLIGAALSFSEFIPLMLGVPVAVTILLLYTQPVWTVIFGKLFLKEEITKYKIFATILVIAGVVVLINPFTVTSIGQPLGITLALIGGVLLACWVIFGRIAGTSGYHPITTEFGLVSFTILFLLISNPIVAIFVKDPSITAFSFNIPLETWFYLLLFYLSARLAAHLFYFYGTKKVTATDAGIILLLEPVSAAILSAVFLNQALTWNILIGGALILLSNYIVIRFAEAK
jgi:drug/metabolite transporter (DMT)-like permease